MSLNKYLNFVIRRRQEGHHQEEEVVVVSHIQQSLHREVNIFILKVIRGDRRGQTRVFKNLLSDYKMY